MDKDGHLESLVDLLEEADQAVKGGADRLVEIEHCIDTKKMCGCKVSCSYRDIVFIICILKDYLKLTAGKEDFMWDYYRERFAKLADSLSVQVGYDYEKQMEICKKKMGAKEAGSDVGEDAMALAMGRGRR